MDFVIDKNKPVTMGGPLSLEEAFTPDEVANDPIEISSIRQSRVQVGHDRSWAVRKDLHGVRIQMQNSCGNRYCSYAGVR